MALRTKKMRKTKTRSRKVKHRTKTRKNRKCKTCHKKTKKRKTKKGGEIGEGEEVKNPIHVYDEKKREEKRLLAIERAKRKRVGPRPLYQAGKRRKMRGG